MSRINDTLPNRASGCDDGPWVTVCNAPGWRATLGDSLTTTPLLPTGPGLLDKHRVGGRVLWWLGRGCGLLGSQVGLCAVGKSTLTIWDEHSHHFISPRRTLFCVFHVTFKMSSCITLSFDTQLDSPPADGYLFMAPKSTLWTRAEL